MILSNLFKKKDKLKQYNPDETCMTCNHVLEDGKPILYINKTKEGEYQFFCGTENHNISECKTVTVRTIVEIDGRIGATLPLKPGEKIEILAGNTGKGLELKKFIQDGVNKIIDKDIQDGKLLRSQLYNNGEIIYYNGQNGTWFDWNMNNKTSWFTVCYNDKKRRGYVSVAIRKNGSLCGYKWGDLGTGAAEIINLGLLSKEDVEYLVRILLQQTDDRGVFDTSINSIDWEASVVLENIEEQNN